MAIDIIYLIILIAAIWKGFSRGLIVAIFSFFSLLLGIAFALKFSAKVSLWLQGSFQINSRWLPILSFLLVFIGVVMITKIVAEIVEKTVEFMFLGWINKLGGILLFTFIYSTIYSVVLFFASSASLIGKNTQANSVCYSFLIELAPATISAIGYVFPFIKNVFTDIVSYLGNKQ